jgi:hypothetical protein
MSFSFPKLSHIFNIINMTLREIKKAIREGKEVCWKSTAYDVKHSVLHDQWMVVCNINESTVGLTTLTGGELIGSEADFFIKH